MQIRYFKSEHSNTSEYYGEGYMTVDKVISFSKVYILIKYRNNQMGILLYQCHYIIMIVILDN